MIEPKIFYRDFDRLLKRIRQEKTGKNFLFTIFTEVQKNFGDALRIGNIKLFEDRGGEFALIVNLLNGNGRDTNTKLLLDSPAVQELLKHGSYLYDNAEFSIDSRISQQGYYAIPAAIVVRSIERRWIVVFELKTGWVREEIVFSLNAIRTALNCRLYSEAVQTELEQAAQIQQSLLPAQPPQTNEYQLAARSLPTEIVGGDLYDFFEFDDDVLGVCIGDASGHGLPAALLVRDVVIGLRMGMEKHMKMVHTFQKLNSVINRSNFSSRFVSLFYGEIERDGHLIFVNAGHPTPFLIKGNTMQDLKATGLILGALPEIKLHRSYAHMEPGSVLVLYSDGILERENDQEQAFNIRRLKKLVEKHQEKSAQEIMDLVFEKVYEYGNRRKWEDDCTVVVIKRLASK